MSKSEIYWISTIETLRRMGRHVWRLAAPQFRRLPPNLEEAKALVAEVPHWHHAFEIYPGLWTPGTYDPTFLLDKMRLPSDLTGKRVLDIGTSDGFFALELARRGGTVVAIDYRDKREHGYYVMEKLNQVHIEYHKMNVYQLAAKNLGKFDTVLFLGVLYHLPDMLHALHVIRSLCKGTLFLETFAANDFCPEVAAARYHRGATLANDPTNFWAPNRLCVLDMLYDSGFDVRHCDYWNDRMFVTAAKGVNVGKLKYGYRWMD